MLVLLTLNPSPPAKMLGALAWAAKQKGAEARIEFTNGNYLCFINNTYSAYETSNLN
jgi:hypothetical protein